MLCVAYHDTRKVDVQVLHNGLGLSSFFGCVGHHIRCLWHNSVQQVVLNYLRCIDALRHGGSHFSVPGLRVPVLQTQLRTQYTMPAHSETGEAR